MASLVLDHIGKSFGDVSALSGIRFEVNQGEVFGLLGPDGAGKSTLLRIIASLLVPDEGQGRVEGFDVVRQYREVRKIIGYMPGRFSLYMDLSVEENLNFYATVFGTTVEKNYDLIREVYEQIAPFRKRLAGRLSGGMKQKLALSCALIHRPRVLLLDEPTTGVDAVSRKEFWELLKKIRQEGITILVSTPYMDEASQCDRVALMQGGRMLDLRDPSQPITSLEGRLYALNSAKGAFTYLNRMRTKKACRSAYLFGDQLHVLLEKEEDGLGLASEVAAWGDESLKWKRIPPGIEDLFMSVMEDEDSEQD
jgi:ABC-type multidrug transport system ATPase subunit